MSLFGGCPSIAANVSGIADGQGIELLNFKNSTNAK